MQDEQGKSDTNCRMPGKQPIKHKSRKFITYMLCNAKLCIENYEMSIVIEINNFIQNVFNSNI